jgi:hypothetical protein
MLGTIVMAYSVESFRLFYLAIPVGIVAVIGNPIEIIIDSPNNSFLLTSSVLVIIATFVTFFTGWEMRKKIIIKKA